MADMNLFSGFQNALSGAGSGLISASKDVESYIQNIYQDAADDISERKKLFKNLVEKIGIPKFILSYIILFYDQSDANIFSLSKDN